MPEMKQQRVYFFHIVLQNFFPNKEQLASLNNNYFINTVLTKQTPQQMFISKFQNIAHIKAPVKCFINKDKIFLGQQDLRFSIKYSDLIKNETFLIKLFSLKQGEQKQLTYYKFNIGKYIQAEKLQKQKYFPQTLTQKSGTKLEIQAYLQFNRAAIQNLKIEIAHEKKRKRSQSIKKRQKKLFYFDRSDSIPILQQFQEIVTSGNVVKKMQQIEYQKQQKIKHQKKLKRKESKDAQLWHSSINKKNRIELDRKLAKSTQGQMNVTDQKHLLDISKITEVKDSQDFGLDDSQNTFQHFSRQNTKSRQSKSKSSPRPQIQKILNKSEISQPAQPFGSTIDQFPYQSSIYTNILKKQSEVQITNFQPSSISSISGSSFSRSYIGVQDDASLSSQDLHSSQVSAASQVDKLNKKRNSVLSTLLIIIAFILIGFLIMPSDKELVGKKSHRKGRSSKH